MGSIVDDRGFNQGFAPSKALEVRTSRRANKILSEMQNSSTVDVIELGCGTGDLSFLLAKQTSAQITGVDLCAPFIDTARRRYSLPNLDYQVLKVSSEGFGGKSHYDYVVGNGILHHLYHQLDDALVNIKSKIRPGGRLLFWEPNLYNPYVFLIFTFSVLRNFARLEPDEMAFTKSTIKQKLLAAGYSDVKVEYRDFLLPNTPDFLIKPFIALGWLLEKLPILRNMSQSIFISAKRP